MTSLAREDALVPWRPGPRELGRRELLVAFGALLAVAAAVYLPHVFTGGFYTDDWFFLRSFHFDDTLRQQLDIYGHWPGAYRPMQTAMLVAQYLATGTSAKAHLALSVPLTAIQAFLLYLVMRMLGLTRLVAGAAALLLDVGLFIDTTRVWSTLQVEMNASSLYLGGLVCALRGFRGGRPVSKVAWHAGAIVLYLAAAFTYEGMLIAIPLSSLAYLVIAKRQDVLPRLAADVVAFIVGVIAIAGTASDARNGDTGIAHMWDRLREVVPGAIRVLRASVPADHLLFGPVGLALVIIIAAGVGLAISRGGALGRAARQWSLIAGASLLFGFVGLAPLLPGPRYLNPGPDGFADRLVIVSAPFYALLLVSVSFLIAIGLMSLARRPALAGPLALILLAGIAIHSFSRERQRQNDLAATWREENRIIDSVTETIPDPAPGTEIVTFRHPVNMPGGFVTFGDYFDLDGALKLAYEDDSIQAHPYLVGAVCDQTGLTFANITFSPSSTLSYGRLYFVDTARGSAIRIQDRVQCKRVAGQLLARRG